MVERVLVGLFVTFSVAWHLLWVFAPPDPGAGPRDLVPGRDFATYYYAAEVALAGGDPWSQQALDAAARKDGIQGGVHPWLYPAPALLAVVWTLAFPLPEAVIAWRVAQELCLLGVALILAWWWRPLGPLVPPVIVGWIAFTWAVPAGLAMGQINALVLLLVVAGLALAERGREPVGGVLLGLACVLKMAPALWLLWWLLRGRWSAARWAGLSAAAASVLTLPLVGPELQLRFLTEVLPGFGSGAYNGLIVKIGLFANHSLPNAVDQLVPGDGHHLSTAARAVSAVSSLGLIGALGALFRGPADHWRVAGQVAAVSALGLLIPVYTFEHHLLFAVPAAVVVTVAVAVGRLHPAWSLGVALVAVALAWPVGSLRALAEAYPGPVGATLRELKFCALWILLAAGGRLGASKPGSSVQKPLGAEASRGFTTALKA